MKKKTVVPYNKESLVKSRKLGRVKGKLTRNQRVAYNVFLKVAYDSLLKDRNQFIFKISIRDFLKFAGFDYSVYHSLLFRDSGNKKSLRNILLGLSEKRFIMEWKNRKNRHYRSRVVALLSEIEMDSNKDYIEFEFPSTIRNYILAKQNFYILYLPVIISMKHSYSIALHEQLLQRKDFGIWRVGKEDFRALLGVGNKYKTKMFDERVLRPAIKEINKVAHIGLSCKKLKHGRKIVAYEFRWNFKHASIRNNDSIVFDSERCLFQYIPPDLRKAWEKAYGNLFSIENDIHRAELWLRTNREKWENRHNNWEKFLSSWLSRTAVDIQAKQNNTATKQKKGRFIMLKSPEMSEKERKRLDNIEVAEAGEW